MATPTQNIFNFIETLLSYVRVILLSDFFQKWEINKKSNQINILGNGPSLHSVRLEEIAGDIMAVNNFAVSEKFESFKPGFYILNAPEYWISDVDDEYFLMRRNLIESLASKLTWDMILFLPNNARKTEFSKELLLIKSLRIQYYNTTPVEGIGSMTFPLFSAKLGMPRPHNVLIPAIMTSIWTGYKTIILYGADHSWMKEVIVDQNNNVFLTQKHFYDNQSAKPEVMKKLGKGQRRLHEILEKFYLAFKAYHVIKSYTNRKNVSVLNCTADSYIDAFIRK